MILEVNWFQRDHLLLYGWLASSDTFPEQLRDSTLIMRQLSVYGAEKVVFNVVSFPF